MVGPCLRNCTWAAAGTAHAAHSEGLLPFILLLCYHAVYNQDNREKVARDEAKFEKEQAEKREQHRQAESQYRHAALLARARQQPLVGSKFG